MLGNNQQPLDRYYIYTTFISLDLIFYSRCNIPLNNFYLDGPDCKHYMKEWVLFIQKISFLHLTLAFRQPNNTCGSHYIVK